MTKKALKGKKVYLRPPEPADCDEYLELSKRSARFHRGLIKMSRTPEEFAGFLERSKLDTNGNFLVCRVSDGAIAGMINLSQIFYGPFCSAYLGYGLGVGFTGQGLMTEAVELIVRYAFKDLKLHRIEANIQPENEASIAVVKRAGFTKEGFSPKYLKVGGKWRDHERWAIVRENWKPNNS
jgi:ribosomal-protein-alanine N-acetyltransferase